MLKKLFVLLAFSVVFVSSALADWDSLATGTTNNLSSAYFLNENKGYIAGASGTILKTTNAGSTFAVSSLGTASSNDVVFASSLEGYFLGGSGALFKTVDEGVTLAQMALPAALTGAAFRKGSASGTRRAFAAYVGTDSYIYYSSDSGAAFNAVAVPTLEIYGVVLTSAATWEWGKNSSGLYTIRKNGADVWTSASQKVNDIFFINDDTAWAVGDSGLLLSKTSAGDTSWTAVSTGVTAHLNACFFLSSQIGWIVGDSGTILFTKNGGTSLHNYADSTVGTTGLRDIYVVLTSGSVVHAYVPGDGGKVFKLQSPAITSVAPTARMQGWIGTIEVAGSQFATVSSLEISGGGISVFSNSVTGGTKLASVIVIAPAATVSTRDVTVNNIDLTSGTTAGSFAVTANPGVVTLGKAWFDGQVPQPPTFETISETPTISFEVSSTAAGVTAAALNGRVLLYQGGAYQRLYAVPASAVSVISASKVNVNYTIPGTLPSGAGTIELYAEDSAGNVGRKSVVVTIGTVGGSTAPPPHATKPEYTANAFVKGYYDPGSGLPLLLQVQFSKGESFPQGVGIIITTGGTDIVLKKVYPLPPRALTGAAGKINLSLSLSKQETRACIAQGIIYNPALGDKVVGTFKVPMVPAAFHK